MISKESSGYRRERSVTYNDARCLFPGVVDGHVDMMKLALHPVSGESGRLR